jgi:hypothetical protein
VTTAGRDGSSTDGDRDRATPERALSRSSRRRQVTLVRQLSPMSDSQTETDDFERTTDHTLFRSVIEEHGGYPAHAAQSEGEGDRGLLRVGFRDGGEDLTQLSWEGFFDEVDERGLVGVYSTDGSGAESDRPVVLRERTHVEGDV